MKRIENTPKKLNYSKAAAEASEFNKVIRMTFFLLLLVIIFLFDIDLPAPFQDPLGYKLPKRNPTS